MPPVSINDLPMLSPSWFARTIELCVGYGRKAGGSQKGLDKKTKSKEVVKAFEIV